MKTFRRDKVFFWQSTWLPFVVFADRVKTCPAVHSEIRRLADRQLLVLQQCKPIEQKHSVLLSHQFHVEYCDSCLGFSIIIRIFGWSRELFILYTFIVEQCCICIMRYYYSWLHIRFIQSIIKQEMTRGSLVLVFITSDEHECSPSEK